MYLFRFCHFLFLLFAFHLNGIAQSDRNHCLSFEDLKVESDTWKSGQTVITSFSKGDIDSVVFIENGQNTGNFLAKNGKIISPRIVIKDQQGRTLSVDSLRVPSWDFRYYTYFTYATLSAVKWEYGLNGIPSKMFLKDEKGEDSLIRMWDEKGILQSESRKGKYPQTIRYYPNGVLKSLENDTVLNHWEVKRVRNYSESGIIQTESWFCGGDPCETWSIYDSKGKLSKTIKHTPVAQSTPWPESLAMEEIRSFIISQQAEAPGGTTSFFNYLESKLGRELCKRRLSGNRYVLRFEIKEDGTCVYKSLQGPDALEIESFFKAAIETSPRWFPAKREGRYSKEVLSLSIQIR